MGTIAASTLRQISHVRAIQPFRECLHNTIAYSYLFWWVCWRDPGPSRSTLWVAKLSEWANSPLSVEMNLAARNHRYSLRWTRSLPEPIEPRLQHHRQSSTILLGRLCPTDTIRLFSDLF